MRGGLFIAILSILAMPFRANAEVRYIMVPELIGEYYGSAAPVTRTVSFAIGAVPSLIRGVRITLVGGATTGILECPDQITHQPLECPWPFELVATMGDPVSDEFWIAGCKLPDQTGPFDISELFRPIFHPGWTFLYDGSGDVTLWVVLTRYTAECNPIEVPYVAIVSQAYLMLDGEFGVPVEPTTWGNIKALYESQD